MPIWKTICFATDFSKASRQALAAAVELAKTLDASLCLLNVVELPIHVAGDAAMLPGAGQVRQLLDDARGHLAEVKVEAEKRGARRVTTETRIAAAAPGEEIVTFAREAGTELLVVGTHGRTGLQHLLLGSVAERVVRRAPCPVLTVRSVEDR